MDTKESNYDVYKLTADNTFVLLATFEEDESDPVMDYSTYNDTILHCDQWVSRKDNHLDIDLIPTLTLSFRFIGHEERTYSFVLTQPKYFREDPSSMTDVKMENIVANLLPILSMYAEDTDNDDTYDLMVRLIEEDYQYSLEESFFTWIINEDGCMEPDFIPFCHKAFDKENLL